MHRQPTFPLCLLLAAALACGRDREPPPPAAEFLVAAGDSTVWVQAGPGGVRSRGSAILLAEVDGRFHEVYVADDDRSYYDAVFVGQRIYRRDLITGDSAIIYEDSVVPRLASSYARSNPSEPRLRPDEEASASPHSMATIEIEILSLLGPYLSVAYHADTHLEQGDESHSTHHGVIDVRKGRPATIAGLFGAAAADSIVARGRRAFGAALDSILAAHDSRASRAVESIGGFEFDPSSWALFEDRGSPAVVFLVPGRGERADGLALPLEPIAAPVTAWWTSDVAPALPTARSDSADLWVRPGYTVAARYDGTSETARITVRDSAGGEWPASTVPLPVQRVHWLDAPPIDGTTREGLARAFDEAVFYSDEARSVRRDAAPRRPPPLIRVAHDRGRTHAPRHRHTSTHRPTHAR